MENQKCSKCKEVKPLAEFTSGNKNNGKSSWCKVCTNIRNRKYYSSNPDARLSKTLWIRAKRRRNPENSILVQIRDRCRRGGIPFNLTIEDCKIPEICPVLGIPIVVGQIRPKGRMLAGNAPSVDRIFPEKGYVKGNIAVISWRANHLKNNATADELEKIVNYIRERS